jgi:hypothetical protein
VIAAGDAGQRVGLPKTWGGGWGEGEHEINTSGRLIFKTSRVSIILLLNIFIFLYFIKTKSSDSMCC